MAEDFVNVDAFFDDVDNDDLESDFQDTDYEKEEGEIEVGDTVIKDDDKPKTVPIIKPGVQTVYEQNAPLDGEIAYSKDAFDDTVSKDEKIKEEPHKTVDNINKPKKESKKSSKQTETKTVSENTLIIPNGCVIEGTVKSKSDVLILGTVKGDVKSFGNIVIKDDGFVEGGILSKEDVNINIDKTLTKPIQGKNIKLSNTCIRCDIKAENELYMDSHAYIKGNVFAKALNVKDALINGDIKVDNNTTLTGESVIKGSLTTGTIDMSPTVKIGANITLKNINDENIDSYFPE